MTITPPLVSADWLHANRTNPSIKIVDATYYPPNMPKSGQDHYRQQHIDSAVFFNIDAIADRQSPLPHMLPDEKTFSAAMTGLGIGNNDHVICYDAHGIMTAPRAWWMLRCFGHDRVSVLDGGLPAWLERGYPVNSETISPAPSSPQFEASFRPELVIDRNRLADQLNENNFLLLDARAADRFNGDTAEIWPGRRAGHIPGSRNLPFGLLLDGTPKKLRPADDIKQLFAQLGLTPDKNLALSCGSGVTACVLALGLAVIGRWDARVYDGSWAEWGLDTQSRDDPLPVGTLEVTTTFLAMTSPPAGIQVPEPMMTGALALMRVTCPTTPFYRFLYNHVGEPWLWSDRRRLDDSALRQILDSPTLTWLVLYLDGEPGGFIELEQKPDASTNICYFGMMPHAIGRKLGPWLLDSGIRTAWAEGAKKLTVSTWSFDHPRALPLYQKMGFVPYEQQTKRIRDPRLEGILPMTAAPHIRLAR